MQISLERIIEGLKETFPECSEMTLAMETRLGELPEWDSMSAVNLQAFARQQFELEVPFELLGDQTTVEELLAFIEKSVQAKLPVE